MSTFPEPWPFLLLGLAVFKASWLVLFSSLLGSHLDSGTSWSKWLDKVAFNSDGTDKGAVRSKVVTGYTCVECVSAWGSVIAVCLWGWCWPWELGRVGWLSVGAVWAVAAAVGVGYHWWTASKL